MCDPLACREKCIRRLDMTSALPCVCDDDAIKLAELVESGIPQRTASLMLWAPDRLQEESMSVIPETVPVGSAP